MALSSGEEKRKLCLEQFQVDEFIDYKETADVIEEVKSLTDGGPNAALVVASALEPLQKAIQVRSYRRTGIESYN